VRHTPPNKIAKRDAHRAIGMASMLRDVGVVLSCFARFGGVAYCLMQAADTIKCVGPSMLPTLNRDGDIVLLDKLTPRLWPLQPGEVVIAKSVSNPRQTVCKRIIATAGDTVCVRPRYSSSEVEFHKVGRYPCRL
jgi:inner membrane protease subunit 1